LSDVRGSRVKRPVADPFMAWNLLDLEQPLADA